MFAESARKLGSLMAKNSIRLVYGGGNVGLMGILADSVLASAGEVMGVIPDFLLKREVGHKGITTLEVVDSMHQRKQRMADLSDAFFALPGGFGTLDELAEILTWKQLGVISQPVVLLNINGFFDPLLEQMRSMKEEGFLRPEYLNSLDIAVSPEDAISKIITQAG